MLSQSGVPPRAALPYRTLPTRASRPHSGDSTFCAAHKLAEMVDVKSKRCADRVGRSGPKLKDRQKTGTVRIADRTCFYKDGPVFFLKTAVFFSHDGRQQCTGSAAGTSRCRCGPRAGKVLLYSRLYGRLFMINLANSRLTCVYFSRSGSCFCCDKSLHPRYVWCMLC